MLNLNTIMIHSEEPDKLAVFYRKVLGEPGFEGNGYTGWRAGNGFVMVGGHSEVKGTNEMPGRILINFETPDVQGEFTRLRDLGAQVTQEPYQPGGEASDMWLATFADPDGNLFQLASPMPQE